MNLRAALAAFALLCAWPMAATAQTGADAASFGVDGDMVALAFSGGGARATAFSLGVTEGLSALRDRDGRSLGERVRLVSGVSGGAVTAAYVALHGANDAGTLREAYFGADGWGELNTHAASPLNWVRAARGGLNDPHRLAQWLDRRVFSGARMGSALGGAGPRLWIQGADLYHGAPFFFSESTFQTLCNDLNALPVSEAVAASMAAPIVFRPYALAAPREGCTAPMPDWPARALSDRNAPQTLRALAQAHSAYRQSWLMRYVHIADGGVVDNLGVSRFVFERQIAQTPYAPFSPEDAVRLRRFLLLVVNAERPRDGTWPLRERGPNGADAAEAMVDAFMDAAKRAAYDQTQLMLTRWESALRAWRCGLSRDDVRRLRGDDAGWECADVHLAVDMISFADLTEDERSFVSAADTRVSLPRAITDAAIAGGRAAAQRNDALLALTR